MSITSSEGGEDVTVSSSEALCAPQTLKRSLISISSDEDSTSYSLSEVEHALLSSDSESDPVFLPDTYESADSESAGETFISDNEQMQVATTIPADNDLKEVTSLLISNCCDRKCVHFLTVHGVCSATDKVNSLSSNSLRH